MASVHSIKENTELKELKSKADKKLVWIGGSDQKEKGVIVWSDGSPFDYIDSRSRLRPINNECVRLNEQGAWVLVKCNLNHPFICHYDSIIRVKGTTNLTLTYSKDKLTGELQVMYSYKYDASSNKLLDSWLEKRMTGFKISWRIENINLPLETTIKDIGRSVQTPGFGGGIIEEALYISDQSYTSTLLLPTTEKVSKWALGRQVVDWSLVIMLDVITNEEEGWQEGVQYKAWSKYKLFKVKKN